MKLTQAEWHLMNALWKGHPATAREISERLPREVDWAYTTVKTMLTRLVEKGPIEEAKRGNTSIYEPVLTRRQARLTALGSVASEAFDGAFGSLVHFLAEEEKLSPTDREKLIETLEGSPGGADKPVEDREDD